MPSCVACSDNILKKYSENPKEFLRKTMNDPYFLEQVSGISELMSEINIDEIDVEDDF